MGVNSGVAYVGAVGTDEQVEFTALGDPVNVAARLAGLARAGEILVPLETLRSARWPEAHLEHRQVELKGKTETMEVVVLDASSGPP